jgi:hypothetical protein
MAKLILTLSSFFLLSFGFSQVNVSPNILGEPFQGQHFKLNTENNDIGGSPLLFDDWKKGEVTLKNGENYHLQKINFDASRSQFIYSINDTIYEFYNNVRMVRIYSDNHSQDLSSDKVFRNDLLPDQNIFVQVLLKGKINILREFSKKPEGENYSNGIVNNSRKYVLHIQDVALIDNRIIPFKYSSSALQELVSDKKSEVDSYVKSNNLKPKKENDFLKSINFYNSINATTN